MTPAIVKAGTRCVDCAQQQRLTVEFLEKLVEAEPAWAPAVAELRSKMDHMQQVGEAALLLSQQFAPQV